VAYPHRYFASEYFPGRYFPPLEDAESGAALIRPPALYGGSVGSWNDYVKVGAEPPTIIADDDEAIAVALLMLA
jgi:hypothetical protein